MLVVGYEHLRQHLRPSAFAPLRPARVKPVLRIDANDAFIAVPAAVAPRDDRMAEAALSEILQQQVAFARRYDRVVKAVDARFDIRNPVLSTRVPSALEHGRRSKRRRDHMAHAVPAGGFDAIEQAVMESSSDASDQPVV